MNRNTILTIVGILVLALAAFLIFSNGTEDVVVDQNQNDFMEEQAEQTAPETTEEGEMGDEEATASFRVTYSDSGFSPATITVPAGATVTFVNESSRTMWVASNPHPTHTGLPGFDSRAGVATGQTYEFTFQNTGSWGYHDHLTPNHGGMVIVE